MKGHNNYIVVIGTSAGGFVALQTLLNAFPKNFPAPILIVKHISADSVNRLPAILRRHSPLSIPITEEFYRA